MGVERLASGFTLLETLVALFLATVAILGAAPMFIQAGHANDTGAETGSLGAIALDRMERLHDERFASLTAGGSLTADVAGYLDTTDPAYTVRWSITDVASPLATKIIVVRAVARHEGPGRRVELTSVRGR